MKIIKHTFIIFIIIALGKLLAFLRDIFVSYFYGSNYETDAYFAANSIPSVIFAAIIASITGLLIPNYLSILKKSSKEVADGFVSKLLVLGIVISFGLSLIAMFYMKYLIGMVAPGFNDITRNLAVNLGYVLVSSFVFSAVINILSAISNAHNKFYAPHIVGIFSSSFIICSLILFHKTYGIYALAISGVVAAFLQMFIQFYIVKKNFSFVFSKPIIDNNVKIVLITAVPVFFSYSVEQINNFVNTVIASAFSPGSLTVVNYAQKLQQTFSGTISMALITVIFPLISSLYSSNRITDMINVVRENVEIVILILFPIVVFLAFNSMDTVKIVYYRGKFDYEALVATSGLFVFYSINVLFLSIREILLRVFYVENNTRVPLFISLCSVAVNLILSMVLTRYFNVTGLAIANLFSGITSLVMMIFVLIRKYKIKYSIADFKFKTLLPYVFFVLICLVFNQLNYQGIVFFTIKLVISMLLFVGSLLLIKQRHLIGLVANLKNGIRYGN